MNTHIQKHVKTLGIVYFKDTEHGHINTDDSCGAVTAIKDPLLLLLYLFSVFHCYTSDDPAILVVHGVWHPRHKCTLCFACRSHNNVISNDTWSCDVCVCVCVAHQHMLV